jgi:hypothetical protein
MGEAKRKAQRRAVREAASKPMKRARFDLFTLGARRSLARLMSIELSHWSDHEERVLGLVFLDTTDEDFGWILMARDKIGRFRCVDLETSLDGQGFATQQLRERIAVAVDEGDFEALGDQEDETNYPTDVLALPTGTDPDKLHPHFRVLMESPGRHPSRSVFKEIGPWLAPSDPDFVSEFQFNQFDQRLWEMFLWATFRELGFDVSQPEAPDFTCQAPGIAFTVEATTVSASTSGVLADRPDPKTPEDMREFLEHYMPMKFGSSLTSKLNKKDKEGRSYWERGDAAGKPFLLAVADFHVSGGNGEPGSMTYTASALWPYLYGHRVEWELVDGELVTRAVKGDDHVFKGKTVETGFFDLPGAENISAVVFSNAGTLAKFDRMGIAAGFIPNDHKYYRMGTRLNPDPNAVHPIPFFEEIGLDDYVEYWSDELQIFHNPNAKVPLPENAFGGITQHFFKDGQQVSITPEGTILGSRTMIMHITGGEEQREII